jgi:hypothetical protein
LSAAESTLQPFRSPDGKFTVSLPGVPERTEETAGSADTGTKQVQYLLGNTEGAYLVSHQDAPHLGNADAATQEQALLSAQNGAQHALKGTLRSSRKITLQQHPGREYELEVANGTGLLRSRMYLAHGRLYQLIVVGTPTFANSANAGQFLDSLRLEP